MVLLYIFHPRQEHSIRKEETKRKRERASKKEREAAEKQQKREELLRLKALKRQELDKKLKLIQQVAGKADLQLGHLDIEADFDSTAHDRRMVSRRDPCPPSEGTASTGLITAKSKGASVGSTLSSH